MQSSVCRTLHVPGTYEYKWPESNPPGGLSFLPHLSLNRLETEQGCAFSRTPLLHTVPPQCSEPRTLITAQGTSVTGLCFKASAADRRGLLWHCAGRATHWIDVPRGSPWGQWSLCSLFNRLSVHSPENLTDIKEPWRGKKTQIQKNS